jgi:hypothetical protein
MARMYAFRSCLPMTFALRSFTGSSKKLPDHSPPTHVRCKRPFDQNSKDKQSICMNVAIGACKDHVKRALKK